MAHMKDQPVHFAYTSQTPGWANVKLGCVCRDVCGSIWIHLASRLLFYMRQFNLLLRRTQRCKPVINIILRVSQYLTGVSGLTHGVAASEHDRAGVHEPCS